MPGTITKRFLIGLAAASFSFACAQTAPVPPASAHVGQPSDRPFELHALAPEFWTVFDHNAQLSTVAAGFGFTEGPVWDPAGFLWVSDESANRIVKVYQDGHAEGMVDLADPDGSTYDLDHRLLSTASGLRAVIRLSADGKSFTTVVDNYHGKKLNTPNDIVIGPDKAIYFTDPTIDMTPEQKKDQELPPSVYRLGPDHVLTLLTGKLPAPNGLAFSPDGKYLYVDDDDNKNIQRFRFNHGTISQGIVFGEMIDPDHQGVPDGMKVDHKGHLFVSGPSGIWVWNKKGVHIGTVQMPHGMANLTWGGPDYSTLFITAGNTIYGLPTKSHGVLGYLQ